MPEVLNALELFKAANGVEPIAKNVGLAEAYAGSCDTCKIDDLYLDLDIASLTAHLLIA